jgi:hypothetical protein
VKPKPPADEPILASDLLQRLRDERRRQHSSRRRNLGATKKDRSPPFVPTTSDAGATTTKSHHAEKNGPDLAGGIGVEAGTCSLGKSEFRISTSVCIVTAAQLKPCGSLEDFESAATAQAARATHDPGRAVPVGIKRGWS